MCRHGSRRDSKSRGLALAARLIPACLQGGGPGEARVCTHAHARGRHEGAGAGPAGAAPSGGACWRARGMKTGALPGDPFQPTTPSWTHQVPK